MCRRALVIVFLLLFEFSKAELISVINALPLVITLLDLRLFLVIHIPVVEFISVF
jgi:hypothetical protein